MDYRDMQAGRVYNIIYVGPNTAYARNNGKQTLLCLNLGPLQTIQLYDPFGSPWAPQLPGCTVTYARPDLAFAEYTIEAEPDERRWFKHSKAVYSLGEALENGLTRAKMARYTRADRHVISHWGNGGVCRGLVISFEVEGNTPDPHLQWLHCCWKSWEEFNLDFARHGVEFEKRGSP